MSNSTVDRNLLFGLLALQNGIINREALVAAFSVWLLDKSRSLDEILVEQRALSPERQVQLQQMLAWHIQTHGEDAAQSLAAVNSASSACQMLADLGDRDIQMSLQPLLKSTPEVDSYATVVGPTPTAATSGMRFHNLRPHAMGGLGEVSIALDTELNREVALKEIQARFADQPESRERFVLEAEITGGLEHPGIVPVYGLGTYSDGRPFYAMRFIKGDSLKDALREFHTPEARSKMSAEERQFQLRKLLGRFIDVCNAIEYAHSRGVLHRDLKPGNVMLGKYGETLVVDWGLAKSVGKKEIASGEATFLPASPLSSSGQTVAGSPIGTPAYMSAEQAEGRLNEVGPTSDVYSLGATLYHLLTGRPPLEGKDIGIILQRAQKGDFPRPRQHDASIPRALEAICLKAMSLKPGDRYPSARGLADDLERWLADEPVTAAKDTLSDRLSRFGRKQQGYVRAGLAGLFVVTMVSITSAALIDAERRQNQALARAQMQIKNASIMSLYFRDVSPLAVFSPNGEFVLSGGDNPTPQLWDARKSRIAFRLAGHQGTVRAAAFSRRSDRLVTCADDGTLKIWGTANGKLLRTIKVLSMPEGGVDPTPAPASAAPEVTSAQLPPLPARTVASVAFSPDGSRIVSGDTDHLVKVWDVDSGKLIRTFTGHSGTVTSVAFDEKVERIVSGGTDKSVKIWNAASGQQLISVSGSNVVNWVTFNLYGDQVHRFDNDNSLTTYVAATGKIVGNDAAISNPFESVQQGVVATRTAAPNMVGD